MFDYQIKNIGEDVECGFLWKVTGSERLKENEKKKKGDRVRKREKGIECKREIER